MFVRYRQCVGGMRYRHVNSPPSLFSLSRCSSSCRVTSVSSPHDLQLQIPHGRERDAGECDRDPGADIGSVPSYQLGHGSRVPGLVHADDCAGPSDQKGRQGGDAEREALLVFPGGPVEGDPAQLAE